MQSMKKLHLITELQKAIETGKDLAEAKKRFKASSQNFLQKEEYAIFAQKLYEALPDLYTHSEKREGLLYWMIDGEKVTPEEVATHFRPDQNEIIARVETDFYLWLGRKRGLLTAHPLRPDEGWQPRPQPSRPK